ncbi:MAG: hypothetical protein AB7I50_13485 [Vicinamibacterales bacterium]
MTSLPADGFPERVARWTGLCIGALLVAHLVGQISARAFHHDNLYGLVPMFDLDGERNAASAFSSLLLLACAICLGVSARQARRLRVVWALLAVAFCLLSIDELAEIHEPLVFVLKGNVSPGTAELARAIPYRFSNMIPQLLAAGAAMLATLVLFLRSLPPCTARLFVAAGILYVGGAVGLDQLTAAGTTYVTSERWRAVLAVAEETLEMTGAALFLYALLDRLRHERLGRPHVRSSSGS